MPKSITPNSPMRLQHVRVPFDKRERKEKKKEKEKHRCQILLKMRFMLHAYDALKLRDLGQSAVVVAV